MNFKNKYFCLIVIAFICSCSSKSKLINSESLIISYESDSCFGRCKVFRFKLNQDRTYEYEGIKNVEKTGVLRGILSKEDFKILDTSINNLNLDILKNIYTSNSTDLQLRVLIINNKSNTKKKILLYDDLPKEISDLEKNIYRIVSEINTK